MPWIKVAIFAISLSGLIVWTSRAIVPVEGQTPQQAAAAHDGSGEAGIGTRIWSAFKKKNPGSCFLADGTGLQLILAYAKYRIEVTADQERAWQAFHAGVTDAGPALREFCRTLKAQGITALPPNWRNLGEVADPLLEREALLRPKFDALYAVLSEAQRERLDGMMGRHREPL